MDGLGRRRERPVVSRGDAARRRILAFGLARAGVERGDPGATDNSLLVQRAEQLLHTPGPGMKLLAAMPSMHVA
jgi:hypothetical protein